MPIFEQGAIPVPQTRRFIMRQDDFRSRLDLLESANRRMKRALMATGACLACAVLAGMCANRFGEIQSTRFVLVDSHGCTRATLELDQGEPVLRMVGSSGTTQVQLGITEVHGDSASLYLQNPTKDTFASLSANPKVGVSTLEFGGGQKRVSISTNLPGSNPRARFTDEAGNETFHAP